MKVESHGLLGVFFENLCNGRRATEHADGLVDILDDTWVLDGDGCLVRDPIPGSDIITSSRVSRWRLHDDSQQGW